MNDLFVALRNINRSDLVDKVFRASLSDPGLDEAFEFVFREYSKKLGKAGPDKRLDLLPIMKFVVKKFNSYGTKSSGFSLDDLINAYIEYRIAGFKSAKLKDTPAAKSTYLAYYGLDTLPDKYQSEIKKFTGKNGYQEIAQRVEKAGIHDPGIFKAFFLAGGGGSGKSFVVSKIFQGHGLKFVNLDPIFEKLMKQAVLDMNLSRLSPEQHQEKEKLRHRARDLMYTQMDQYMQNRLGLVIDGTGRNYYLIEEQEEALKKLGYDTYMVFVDTSLEVALSRNQLRSRKLPNNLVKEHWHEVQHNKKAFQKLFGKNFILIDNNNPAEKNEALFIRTWKTIRKYVNLPIKNKIAQQWIGEHR